MVSVGAVLAAGDMVMYSDEILRYLKWRYGGDAGKAGAIQEHAG